jgi:excisionase family DNA binding protein
MNEILTVQDVAELLQLSEQTVRTLTAKNEIPSYRIGNIVRYNRSEIMNLFGGRFDSDPVLDWLLEQINKRRRELARGNKDGVAENKI